MAKDVDATALVRAARRAVLLRLLPIIAVAVVVSNAFAAIPAECGASHSFTST